MTMVSQVSFAIAAFVMLNLWTVLRFWQDKQRARSGELRIPESKLSGLAMLGGAPGALLARRIFRHKTRKEPFSTRLLMIAALQAGAVIGLTVAFV